MEKESAKLELFLDCYMQLEEKYREQAEQMLRECTENQELEPELSSRAKPPMAAGS